MGYSFPSELHHMIAQELASGDYASEDDLLLEAVRLLRQRSEDLRQFKSQFQGRIDRLDRAGGIELEDEIALRAFFDDVQSRGEQRYQARPSVP